MRGGRIINSKAILLVILVVASLAVPLLSMSKTSEAAVFPNVDNIFAKGKDSAYSYNNNPPAPIKTYAPGDEPPVMMANQIDNGRVVASGLVTECRMSPASDNFVALMDAIFQWLYPGATNILWFNGYGVYVTSSSSSALLTKLEAKGYTFTGSASTPINPAGYDILVLPEMQLGSGSVGGDPTLLPDADIANIRNFALGGKGLLIMSGSDYFGPTGGKGNFYNVMNKILENLGFGYGGQLFGFQGDSVYDDFNNATSSTDVVTSGGDAFRPIIDINTAHPIGAAYQAATGRTDLRAYGGCSLVQLGKGMATYVIPTFRVGMPGDTLTYRFRIFNTGVPTSQTPNVDLTIALSVTDNSGWSPTLDNSSITLSQDDSYYVIVRVTIPNGTPLSAEDTITVTADAGNQITGSLSCIAKAGKPLESTADAFVDSVNPETNYGDNTKLEVGRFQETSGENNFYNTYLKFNLADIPSNASITEARLYLYCYHAYGSPQDMKTAGVDDDSWDEHSITYNNAPALGSTVDTQTVSIGSSTQPTAYSWDVTSYVQSEFAGDQVVSFGLTRASESPSSAYRYFDSKEYFDNDRPLLMVIYTTGVPVPSVSVSPSSQENSPGGSLTYTVNVMNTGDVSDTFNLTVSDNAGWSPTVSPTSVTVAAGDNETATLSVTIPSSAVGGTIDGITVTATSQTYSTSDSASCTAHALVTGSVEVTISPTSKSGAKGATITYSVTVTNTGANSDTFNLQASDTLGWGPSLTITSTTLAAGASRAGIKLSITVPSSASVGDASTITVTATGTGYDNTATCTATAAASSGTSVLLYVVIAVVVIVIIAVVIIVLR